MGWTSRTDFRLVSELALWHRGESSFKEIVEELKQEIDGLLLEKGLDPRRRKGDRSSEIVEDVDSRFFDDMTATGVSLRARGEIARVSAGYDKKEQKGSDEALPRWADHEGQGEGTH